MADPLADILQPLSPEDQMRLRLGIRAPQALGPLAGQPPTPSTSAATPPSPNLFSLPAPSPLGLPAPEPKPLSQVYGERLAAPPSSTPGALGYDPAFDPKSPQNRVSIVRRILGTIGEMSTNKNLSEAAEGWIHPAQAKLGLATQQYEEGLKGLNVQSEMAGRESEAAARAKERPDTKAELPADIQAIMKEHPSFTVEQAMTAKAQAETAGKPAAAKDEPLGASVPQLNKALTDRFQVLNPGKPLPPEFTLGVDATQKDYDRVDKALENVERASGTKAQQEQTNALREQILAETRQRAAESKREFQPAIQQQVVVGMGTQRATRRLLDILGPYKEDNTPFGSFLKTVEYRLGRAQSDEIGQELASINLTSLQQAGSVLKNMGGVRAAQVLEKVLQHTPDPTKDSVKNMYDKLINIDRATTVFLDDADKYGRKAAADIPAESLAPYTPSPTAASGPWSKYKKEPK